MSNKIKIKAGNKNLTAVLNNSRSAELFYQKLPHKIKMHRWGDEYYGDCGLTVEKERDARSDMDAGEIAIWPDGNALCIFFGPTPASTTDKPRAISPVNPIGIIEGDFEFLKGLPTSIEVEVEKI